MEPLTIASAFASIVGLLGVFKSERRAEESATIDQFIDWLRRHEHEQLANNIMSNTELTQSLQKLLSQQHDEVMIKLRELDRVLSNVANHITDFKAITDALAVTSLLSDQAVHILHQMNEANASRIAEIKTLGCTSFQTWDGECRNIEITNTRFIEDDLLTLCEIGLLWMDYGSSGTRFFNITRAGAEVGSVI